MTYGEAVQDTSTKLGRDAAASHQASKNRVAIAQEIAERTGRDLLEILTEMHAETI